MEQPIDVRTSRRVKIVGRIVVLWGLGIAGALIYTQAVKHEHYLALARQQQQHVIRIPAARGEITDRRGDTLAISIETQSAAVNPQRVKDPRTFAALVSRVLDIDAASLEARILELQERGRAKKSGRGYLMIKRHVTKEEAARLKRHWFGEIIEILRDSRREYPNGTLAAHVVGSLDSESKGNSGIEQKLDAELAGRPGRMRVLTDSLMSRYVSWIEDQGEQGMNLRLSIDRNVQHETEQALKRGVQAAFAKQGTVVVMDPRTGEILALANYPTFDPRIEKPTTKDEIEARRNIAVMAPVEPGSVMKMITVTMGLDTGKFQESTMIHCENGSFPRPKRPPIHDVHPYGGLDVEHVLIKSSNIGVAKISIACGPRTLYQYLKAFGLGDRTGIELPGETRGLLNKLDCRDNRDRACWSPVSHEYIAFGHEIGATALQLARAVSVIANDGMLVQPHLVIGKTRPKGDGAFEPVPVTVEEPKRALRAETAHRIRLIMQKVVLEGTGKRAALQGWTSGGKTGSAEMYIPGQGWVNRHNSSFIGFAPVTNPRIAVVVTISDTPLQGGIAAAPVFKEVASAALRTLNVLKDDLDRDLKPGQAGPKENMKVVAEPPPARIAKAAPAPEQAVEANAETESAYLAGPQVPDFRGKTVLAVLRESASMRLPVEIVGSGVARGQKPGPGAFLPPGHKVQVEFARP